MAAVTRVFKGTHTAQVPLTCPECHEKVLFPFDVTILFEESDKGLPMKIVSAGFISDQPLFDHKLEAHGPGE